MKDKKKTKQYCSTVMMGRPATEKPTLTILFTHYAGSSCNRETYIIIRFNTVHLLFWVVLY